MKHGIKVLLLAATALGSLATGCSISTEDDDAVESTAMVESELGNCCSGGAFFCPDGQDWSYAPPGCGEMLKPAASTACRNHCGTSCRDTGWLPTC